MDYFVFLEIALHITRTICWDGNYVILFDDETIEMAKEIVRCNVKFDREWFNDVKEYENMVLKTR